MLITELRILSLFCTGVGKVSMIGEVVIAIDTSKQLTQGSLSKILDFLKASLKSYNEATISDDVSVTARVLSYGKTVKELPTSKTIGDALKKIEENFPEVGGERNLPGLLDYVNNDVFGMSRGGFLDAKKLLLLTVIGGEAETKDVRPQALNGLEYHRVEILTLAIDVPITPLIAICPPSNIIQTDDERKLPTVVGPMEKAIGKILGKIT